MMVNIWSTTAHRFSTPDSIVPDGTDPQDYNRYAYAGNNPVKYKDPSGHVDCAFYEGECLNVEMFWRKVALLASDRGPGCSAFFCPTVDSSERTDGSETHTQALPLFAPGPQSGAHLPLPLVDAGPYTGNGRDRNATRDGAAQVGGVLWDSGGVLENLVPNSTPRLGHVAGPLSTGFAILPQLMENTQTDDPFLVETARVGYVWAEDLVFDALSLKLATEVTAATGGNPLVGVAVYVGCQLGCQPAIELTVSSAGMLARGYYTIFNPYSWLEIVP